MTTSFSPGDTKLISSLSFSINGTGLSSKWVYVCDIKNGEVAKFSNLIAVTPDCARGLTETRMGEVDSLMVFDYETGKNQISLKRNNKSVVSASFSSDGKSLFAISVDGLKFNNAEAFKALTPPERNYLQVWKASTGEETLNQTLGGGEAFAAFSPNGTRILAGDSEHVALLEVRTGKKLLNLEGQDTHAISTSSFNSDGSRVMTYSMKEKQTKLWDVGTGAELLSKPGSPLVFAPDGACFLTVADGVAHVWDANTGEERVTLSGHLGGIRAAQFSPDGTRILTGGADKTAKLWDVKSGIEVLALKDHTGPVDSVAFSTDGVRIVTVSEGVLFVWDSR